MDEMNENMDEMAHAEDIDTNDANTAEKAVDLPTEEWSAPPKRDEKTGRFIAGTGGSLKGGRPKGSKDRVSKAMVDLATELVADRGRELFHEMADRDPAQALALVSKIISPEELRAVYAEDRAELENKVQEVTIRMVSAPTPRKIEGRTEQEMLDRQRGLEAPVERLRHVSEDAVVATQEDADDEAAEAERERVRRQNEAIRQHGGLTGKPARSAARDTLDYPDDHTI